MELTIAFAGLQSSLAAMDAEMARLDAETEMDRATNDGNSVDTGPEKGPTTTAAKARKREQAGGDF